MSWGIGDRVGVAVGIGNISSFLSKSIQSRGPQPSLILDFAGTGTLDSRITFTRSTTGTYYNSSGVLTSAAINAARFDYNPSNLSPLGLLIEQSSTNIALYSEQFDNALWVKASSTVVANATTAPDGTSTADLIYPTSNGTFRGAYQTVLAGNTVSIDAKFSGIPYLYIVDKPGSTGAAWFNLSTGAAGTVIAGYTSSIQSLGNGWYRCILTANTGTFNYFQFGLSNTDNSLTVTASGTNGAYIWAAQDEALLFASSYIPTTLAQVTRANDVAQMTGTNFSSWYNTTEGTWYAEFTPMVTTGTSRAILQTNQYSMYLNTGGSVGIYDGTNVALNGTATNNALNKATTTYSTNKLVSCLNGNAPTVTNAYNGIFASSTSLALSGANLFNGRIKKLAYYKTALTNAQLQALTI
jgi:hypothetical protein